MPFFACVPGRLSRGVFPHAAPRQAMPAACDETWTISWRYCAGRRSHPFLHSNRASGTSAPGPWLRSEEHTSELQSRVDLVCRLLLEKKKKQKEHCLTSQNQHRGPSYTYSKAL